MLFKFPTRHGFNARSIFEPGYKITFSNAEDDSSVDVFADPAFSLSHTSPVVIDRNNTFPTIHLIESIDYKVIVHDRHGQEIYRIRRLTVPDTLTLPTISYTNGLVTGVSFTDGTTAAYTYNNGLADTMTVSDGINSRVLTANYTGGLITSIS